MLRLLLAAKARADVRNGDGVTALLAACKCARSKGEGKVCAGLIAEQIKAASKA